MRSAIISCIIFFSLAAFCQTEPVKQDKWKLGIAFSPDVYLIPSDFSEGNYVGYDLNRSPFKFSTGIIASLAVKPKIDIGTGIIFSKKDFSGTGYCHVCMSDFIYMPPQPVTIKQRYLEIPVFVQYNILNKKLDLHLQAGLTSGFLTSKPTGELISHNKFLFGGQLGIGMNLDLGQRFNLSWTTLYRHPLKNFSDENYRLLRTFSFVTGVSYRIKKQKS